MDVYEPREDSELLEAVVREHARGACIDIGTGTGIQAFAALENPNVTRVVAVDINPAAVARVEARIAELAPSEQARIHALQSDMYEHVAADDRFDTIISNTPYLPDEETDVDPALYGGPGGYEWILRCINESLPRLARGGQMLLVISSLSNKERIDRELKARHLIFEEVAELAMFFERLFVYRIRRP